MSDKPPDWRTKDNWLPNIRWGTAETPLPAPSEDTEPDPDDEPLPETPPDVIAMLGFDPRKSAEFAASSPPPRKPKAPPK